MKKLGHKLLNLALTKNRPVSLVHFLTNRCNARCPHCFIDFDNEAEQKDRMSLEDIERLTRTLGPQLMNVNLTGGEPFLRRDLPEIVRAYFRNSAVDSVFLSSHGGMTAQILRFARELSTEFPDRKLIFSLSIDHFAPEHDSYRKVPRLFENALQTYAELAALGPNVFVNVGITVSPFNQAIVLDLYDHLFEKGVRAFTATLVRDEGVYRTPADEKEKLLNAYAQLTERIHHDILKNRTRGYSPESYLGRMMNEKNRLMNENIRTMYLDNRFISPCQSGALFGVLYPNGDVFPCEVRMDKKMGNVYDTGLDFLKLWDSHQAKEVARWVKASKCRCTYECAWSYNLLGNPRYYPQFAKAVLKG